MSIPSSLLQANRWLKIATITFLVLVAGTVLLILNGVFDPQPLGDEQITREPGPAGIPANNITITWLDPPQLTPPYTIQLTAQHESGETDIGYGLMVGSPEHFLVVAVSPLGYVSIWEEGEGEEEQVTNLPWQTWPHVRTGSVENEIWLDNDGVQVAVRLNRELLWSGEVNGLGNQLGLYGESFGEPAGVNFSSIMIWHGNQ